MQKTFDKKFGFLSVQDIIAIFTILLGLIFLLWKVPYGFGMDDESFYLTIPQRLMQGDSLLTDEWHVSQLSYLFIYIPYKLFVLTTSSTEGIIIYFRYIFVFIQTTMAIIIYTVLRKHGIFSIFSVMIYYLHIPLTYMYVNYNSLGLAFVISMGLILLSMRKENKLLSYFLGVLMACAVLCNPALLLLYLMFTIITLIYLSRKNKETKISKEIFGLKSWLFTTLGCLTIFMIFVSFVLSRTTVAELIKNIPMLFTDIEYQFSNYEVDGVMRGQNILDIASSLITIINFNRTLFVAYIMGMVLLLIDKKRHSRKIIYHSFFTAVFVGYLIFMITSDIIENYAYWMMTLTFYGLSCYLLSDKKDKRMFYSFWVLGIFYSFALDITADSGPITSTMAMATSNIASVFFVRDLIEQIADELKQKNKTSAYEKNNKVKQINIKQFVAVGFSFVLVLQLALQIRVLTDFNKISFEYDGQEITPLNVKLEYGPQKGIITTRRKADIYYGILSDLDFLKDKEKKPLFVAENMPYCYLYLDMPIATYSTWYIGESWNMDMVNERFDAYYELHPDKVPKYYYITKRDNYFYNDVSERAEKMVKKVTDKIDCIITEGKEGYILEVK